MIHLYTLNLLKDTLKAYDNFKNQAKSVWSNVFSYVKGCMFSKRIWDTVHWEQTNMLKTFPSGKKSGKKSVFSFESSNSSQFLLLIWDSYMSWRFVSLKLCVEFCISDSVSFWLKFIFFCYKIHRLFTLKPHNSFQN